MTRIELIAICARLDACAPAFAWLRSLDYETAAECWDACERGDWMIWLLTARPGIVPDRTLRMIAVDCARAVQPIADAWFAEHAPRHVAAGTRLLDLVEADPDADPATWYAAASTAADAVRVAMAARDTARVAVNAARYSAVDAVRAACSAAVDAVSDAAVDAVRADQARTVRARVTWADVERGLREVVR